MMPRLRPAVPAPRVAIAIDDATAANDITLILNARGLTTDPMPLEQISDIDEFGARAVAYAPGEPPNPALSARIAPLCRDSAVSGRPVVMLCAFPHGRGKNVWLRAASLAYLRAWGAIVCTDPDEWLETVCLIAGYGLPGGSNVAIVAPEGSFLSASATSLANEAELVGDRFPSIATTPGRLEPVDIALVDRAALSPSTPERVGRAMIVPVVGRAELLADDERIPLVGLRAAMAAAGAAGRLAKRLQAGLGPATTGRDDPRVLDDLQPDLERFERQIEKLDTRAGDHEAKVLLKSWGIPITRQAVATTPSAATRVAKKAGYPVEVKPWGPDQLSERDGCPVERELYTAADVRRAVANVAKAAGLPLGAPVIVRETPPPGRAVSARIVRVGALGWMVGLDVSGNLAPVAAPAPLRAEDAAGLTRAVEASRAADPAPDRDTLANILTRASHLAVYHQNVLDALYLHHVTVTSKKRDSVVVDAQAVLLPRD